MLGAEVPTPPTGVGVAGAVSVNIVHDTVQASIADAGNIMAGDVIVTAVDDFFQLSVTGGAAFVVGQREGSKSIAGAFSVNYIDVKTRAFIVATDIDDDRRRHGDRDAQRRPHLDLGRHRRRRPAPTHRRRRLVRRNVIFNETEATLQSVVAHDRR